jgi:predicted DsbA family dithiol-disulfide isomerase
MQLIGKNKYLEEMNNTIHTKIIIIASIFSLVILSVFYIIFVSFFNNTLNKQEEVASNSKNQDRYYLNYDYDYDSDFVTKVPNLEDMLTGPIITSLDPSIGNKEAEIVIVVFSDFECKYCRDQEKTIQKILEKYNNQVRFVWKDYPEQDPTSISYQAALAARCAQKQGKFWDYHDELYSMNNLGDQALTEVGEIIGLDIDEFQICFNTMQTAALINDNIEEANALDIGGIPFVYINDQEVLGGANQEDLERIIEIELGNN